MASGQPKGCRVGTAALLAARNGKELVTMEEFNEAVERVSVGLEKRSRILLEELDDAVVRRITLVVVSFAGIVSILNGLGVI